MSNSVNLTGSIVPRPPATDDVRNYLDEVSLWACLRLGYCCRKTQTIETSFTLRVLLPVFFPSKDTRCFTPLNILSLCPDIQSRIFPGWTLCEKKGDFIFGGTYSDITKSAASSCFSHCLPPVSTSLTSGLQVCIIRGLAFLYEFWGSNSDSFLSW